MAGDTPAIELEGVDFAFGALPVLEGVDLRVGPREFMALLGPNGGGKTTLLKLVLGILRPQRGRVRVLGAGPGAHSARVGYVPQHTNIKPGFPATVEEVTLLGLGHQGLRGFRFHRDQRERARAAMAQAGVEGIARQPGDELSGGQRQRVLIARALISEPELLIFDEPTANIDPHGTHCFHELLAELREKAAIVLVSHDLASTAPHVDSVACINRRLLYNPEPIMTRDMLSLLYGAHPDSCPMGAHLNELSGYRIDHPAEPHA